MQPQFRRTRAKCALLPEQRAREGRLVRSAQEAFPDIAAALAFLNSHHEALGARPLDLALASEDGLRRAEAIIGAHGQEPRQQVRKLNGARSSVSNTAQAGGESAEQAS